MNPKIIYKYFYSFISSSKSFFDAHVSYFTLEMVQKLSRRAFTVLQLHSMLVEHLSTLLDVHEMIVRCGFTLPSMRDGYRLTLKGHHFILTQMHVLFKKVCLAFQKV